MQAPFNRTTCFAAVAAATIVGFTGLLLDRSLDVTYDGALPAGVVEICEIQSLTPSGCMSHGDAQH